MEMNEYALEVLVHCRLAEMRAKAERLNRIRVAGPAPGRRRVALGDVLVRVGHLLLGVRGILW